MDLGQNRHLPTGIGSLALGLAMTFPTVPVWAQSGPPAAGSVDAPLPRTPETGGVGDQTRRVVPPTTEAANRAEPEQGLGDIIVTAQRRSENLQNVPVAITALSSSALASANVSTVNDLRLVVPSLNITNNNGILSTSLRGIGSTGVNPGFENPVATYVDGVYIASTVASFLSLSDVSQIDVLKGPQGTLFGRNATAGLIQITTRTPTQDAVLEAKLGYGNYDTVEGSMYVAGGIAKGVAADLAVYGLHQGQGFGRNQTTGADTYQVSRDVLIRSKVAIDLTPSTVVVLTGDWTTVRRNDLAGVVIPGTINANAPAAGRAPDIGYDQVADSPTYKTGVAWGGSLKVDQQVGALTLTSLTAYRQSRFTTAFDYDQTLSRLADLRYRQPEDQFSQELQIAPKHAGKFVWIIGGYYFKAHAAYDPFNLNIYAAGQLLTIRNKQETESLAGYAQGTYEILPETNLTLGGRYTTERRRAYDGSTSIFLIVPGVVIPLPAEDREVTFNKFTFRAALDHRFSPEILAYASVNRGFKSGGFNTGNPGSDPYSPETVDAYEIGLKTDLLDRRLRLNVAAYYDDYINIQSQLLTQGVISIVNAASARTYGIDVDAQAKLSQSVLFTGGFAWNDARYRSYPLSPYSDPGGGIPSTIRSAAGNYLPLASRFTANGALTYTAQLNSGRVVASANLAYNSGYFLESDNAIKQHAFAQLGSTLTWSNATDRYTIGIFGKNLTNKKIISFATAIPTGLRGFLYAPPRTYGLTVGVKF